MLKHRRPHCDQFLRCGLEADSDHQANQESGPAASIGSLPLCGNKDLSRSMTGLYCAAFLRANLRQAHRNDLRREKQRERRCWEEKFARDVEGGGLMYFISFSACIIIFREADMPFLLYQVKGLHLPLAEGHEMIKCPQQRLDA